VVERSMFWDQRYYAAIRVGVEQLVSDWIFAEDRKAFSDLRAALEHPWAVT